MKTEQAQIHEFMVKAQQETPTSPTMPSPEVCALRVRLIAEELVELAQAMAVNIRIDRDGGQDIPKVTVCVNSNPFIPHKTDLVEAYDAVLDLLVVTVGAGVALGTDLQPGWDCVHSSNMAKFAKGGYRRADGKWMKPPDWTKPNLAAIIEAQIQQADQQEKLPL